jgi:BirA family biotin operon repressor/biotin-[acetyl-CoA-carboxylase] ligase
VPIDLDRYHRHRRTVRTGQVVHYREESSSTMDDAREGAAAAGADGCGAAYVAGRQTAGRGRQGRTWISAAGVGLYVTYHLCPVTAGRAPLLSIAGALAAAEAIEATANITVELKWPNDVLHGGKKLCGVLAESRAASGGGRLDAFVGIGINVLANPDLDPEVAAIATSIEGVGCFPPPLEELLAAVSNALEPLAAQVDDDPAALITAWRRRLITLGERVRLATPSGEVEGDAVDVTERGELVLRLDGGTTQAFSAGDVTTV